MPHWKARASDKDNQVDSHATRPTHQDKPSGDPQIVQISKKLYLSRSRPLHTLERHDNGIDRPCNVPGDVHPRVRSGGMPSYGSYNSSSLLWL
jgi:hypothetical protein